PLLASHLSHVVITRTLKGSTANVASSGSKPLDVEQVERMVRGKERRLNKYKGRYRQVWLFIMVGTLGAHSFARLSEQVKPGCIQSMFDRVCLCDPFWNPTFYLDVVQDFDIASQEGFQASLQ
ncbi:MAG: hypothetical protein KC519_12955, partial [Anaerolineae bacterium]|nr:hypothetical protein [Anaerolineae bacterium]